MQTSQMQDIRVQQLGLGGRRTYKLIALLLCLSLLQLDAQDIQPTELATTTTSTQTAQDRKSTPAQNDSNSPQSEPPFVDGNPVLSEICGKTKYSGKLVGGSAAKSERWPWQASLLFRGKHICGAVLIDKNWVASAAHCFQRSRKSSDYRILLGYHQLSNPTNYSQQMTVHKLIFHENYNKLYHQGSDIVLIHLHTPLEYSSHILPACVPENTTKVPIHSPCWISGWGMLSEDKFLPAPFHLQEAKVFLLEQKECEKIFQSSHHIKGQFSAIREDMICAGDLTNGKSICRGDSGGPLVCQLNESWYVVGLSSWTAPCLQPITSPNIFTKVSYFANWIQKMKKATPDPDPSLVPPQEKPPSLNTWRRSKGIVISPTLCLILVSQIFSFIVDLV